MEQNVSKTNRMLTCVNKHHVYIDYLHVDHNYSGFVRDKQYVMHCPICKERIFFNAEDGEDDVLVMMKQNRRFNKERLVKRVCDNAGLHYRKIR